MVKFYEFALWPLRLLMRLLEQIAQHPVFARNPGLDEYNLIPETAQANRWRENVKYRERIAPDSNEFQDYQVTRVSMLSGKDHDGDSVDDAFDADYKEDDSYPAIPGVDADNQIATDTPRP